MKVLFFGTPNIAVPFLDWLINHHQVVGIICKPDEPVGRGYKLTRPPIKVLAEQHNIPVFQPEGKWTDKFFKTIKDLGADVGVAVAYGRIMPEKLYQAPTHGTFNVHFSLLPKYRGAAPMQWSLIKGEKETGVTLFWLDKGMDSGPICDQVKIKVKDHHDAVTLKEDLIKLGVGSLEKVLKDISNGNSKKVEQKGEASLAPMLRKIDGDIDWTKDARDIQNLVKGVIEWPGARTSYMSGGDKKQLKVFGVTVIADSTNGSGGEIVNLKKNEGFIVKTGSDSVLVKEVQPEGKKRMSAWSFWQGAHLKIGDKLG